MKLSTVPPPTLTPAAFQHLYRQHSGQLCGYLTKCLRGDSAEAEGIVQEAFLKAWEKRDSLKDAKAFKSWLYSIAINALRQRKRKMRPLAVETIEKECERPSPEHQAADRQELDRAREALDALPDDQREAILLVRIQCLKFREAAEALGVPENTVKTWVRRGLMQIADALDL